MWKPTDHHKFKLYCTHLADGQIIGGFPIAVDELELFRNFLCFAHGDNWFGRTAGVVFIAPYTLGWCCF